MAERPPWWRGKRARRHYRLAWLAAASVLFFYLALSLSPEIWRDPPIRKAEGPLWLLSMSLADTALLFLSATLLIGPLNVLRRRPNPTHSAVRRDLGLWAGGLALSHALVGMNVHTEHWRIWMLFFWTWPSRENPLPLHLSWFGLANTIGLFVTASLIILLLLSNNLSLRRLGPGRWKLLQRLSYLMFLGMAAHAYIYQTIERRIWPNRLFLSASLLLVGVVQLLGAHRHWQMYRRRARRTIEGTAGKVPGSSQV